MCISNATLGTHSAINSLKLKKRNFLQILRSEISRHSDAVGVSPRCPFAAGKVLLRIGEIVILFAQAKLGVARIRNIQFLLSTTSPLLAKSIGCGRTRRREIIRCLQTSSQLEVA